MRRPRLASALLAAAAFATACSEDASVQVIEPQVTSRVDTWAFIHALPSPAIDILFVVDDSSSMAGEQRALAASFPDFISVLRQLDGGLPDVHIGVVSADVGAAGMAGVPGCAGAGGDGELLVRKACTGLDGRFISDVTDGRSGRIRNYTGELEDLLSCMAALGTRGCEFEMPLEAMYRALQPGKNPGFLRPDAYLLVVIITDEDDCSTDDAALFGAPDAGLDSPLGPRTSFRCFEHGVECDGGGDPRAFGARTGCRPRADSPYLVEIGRYVQFLRGLKRDPSLVMVSAIAGIDDERHTVVVGPDPANPAYPAVQRSCFLADGADPDDGATPPIRLGAFVRSFPNRSAMTSLCAPFLSDALVVLAGRARPAFHHPCLHRPLADRNPLVPGVQPECSMWVSRPLLGGGTDERVIAACTDTGGVRPCWELAADEGGCPYAPGHLSLHIASDGLDRVAGFGHAQCVVE